MLCPSIYGSAPWVSLRIANAQIPLINAHMTHPASGSKFGMSLHPNPYFVNAISEGSSEFAHMHRLT